MSKMHISAIREKGKDLIQSYAKSLYIDRKLKKGKVTARKRYQNLRLNNDRAPN